MQKNHIYHVYIMASQTGTLYIGVTSDIRTRVQQHKQGYFEGFSKKYGCKHLVYYEEMNDVQSALEREKQLKKWSRKKKEFLIKTMNPHWTDLAKDMLT